MGIQQHSMSLGSKTDAEQERHSFKGMYVVQSSLCNKSGPWHTALRHSASSDKIGGAKKRRQTELRRVYTKARHYDTEA